MDHENLRNVGWTEFEFLIKNRIVVVGFLEPKIQSFLKHIGKKEVDEACYTSFSSI